MRCGKAVTDRTVHRLYTIRTHEYATEWSTWNSTVESNLMMSLHVSFTIIARFRIIYQFHTRHPVPASVVTRQVLETVEAHTGVVMIMVDEEYFVVFARTGAHYPTLHTPLMPLATSSHNASRFFRDRQAGRSSHHISGIGRFQVETKNKNTTHYTPTQQPIKTVCETLAESIPPPVSQLVSPSVEVVP